MIGGATRVKRLFAGVLHAISPAAIEGDEIAVAAAMRLSRDDKGPGVPPAVTSDRDGVVFTLRVSGHRQIPPDAQLVLRCDASGHVWARLATAKAATGTPEAEPQRPPNGQPRV